MTAPTAQQRYWLGNSSPKVHHLLAQAEFPGPHATALPDRIGVAPGASVIDIGCGVLGILRQLRSRVGNKGRAVGLDIEPRLPALTGQLSARHSLGAQTVRADAASTGLPSGSFDLVHERMLLLNVTRPEDVVAEMARPPTSIAAGQRLWRPASALPCCRPLPPAEGDVGDAAGTVHGLNLETVFEPLQTVPEPLPAAQHDRYHDDVQVVDQAGGQEFADG